ncbi:hypothetical protein V1514DRAFT_334861 [Lipomyces japonicus]|uniref:uncharacterized protein n=1 Tax=Lipomyces japonicus TaxID=56871 RepID=UPI0034CFC028
MASDPALVASRFAVSVAQTKSLVASWLDSASSSSSSSSSSKSNGVDDNDDNKVEDADFSKRYGVIVGKGGVGSKIIQDSQATTGPDTSAMTYRQRKTIEFMQKQALKRQALNARSTVAARPSTSGNKSINGNNSNRNGREEHDDDDEEESRASGVTGKKRKESVLDDILQQRQGLPTKKQKQKKQKQKK